jgi:hypothetical protein
MAIDIQIHGFLSGLTLFDLTMVSFFTARFVEPG